MTEFQRVALLQKIILRAQTAIRRDVRSGVVPRSANSLDDLANYVDANVYLSTRYGPLTRDLDALVVSVGNGERDVRPLLDLLYEAKTKVDAWLRAGGARIVSAKSTNALLQKIVLRAQQSIIRDVQTRLVPQNSRSLEELARVVDTNMYFLTRAGNFDRDLERLATPLGDGEFDQQPMFDVLNEAMILVDAWLHAGGAQAA